MNSQKTKLKSNKMSLTSNAVTSAPRYLPTNLPIIGMFIINMRGATKTMALKVKRSMKKVKRIKIRKIAKITLKRLTRMFLFAVACLRSNGMSCRIISTLS